MKAAAGSDGEQAQGAVLRQVEASAALIDEMVGEITREMFLGAAVSHVTESPEPGSSAGEVVAGVVGPRLEQLDSTFLATLDGYIQGAGQRGATDVAELLLLVRDEVLRRLGQRLPPEMQLLEAALSAADSKARMALLRQYAVLAPEQLPQQPEQEGTQPSSEASGNSAGDGCAASEGAGLQPCLAADLERAASQVVGDMELMVEVPDRRLLAKLVLLREEVQQILEEASFAGAPSAQMSPEEAALQLPFRQLDAIPKSCAVFLQRVMAVPTSAERRSLLEHALQADTERAPSSLGPDPTNFERARAESEKPQEWVRPGRFMQSLNALQYEMLQRRAGGSGDSGSSSNGLSALPSDATLERLESIRREALSVLLDVAGEGQPYLP